VPRVSDRCAARIFFSVECSINLPAKAQLLYWHCNQKKVTAYDKKMRGKLYVVSDCYKGKFSRSPA